jgi:two-component system, NtrC family, sensor histidine kinase AtoS
MKSFSSQFTSTFLRKKEPGLPEIFALINLYEEPCALIDIKSKKTVFINSRMMKLTGFSTSEVIDKGIDILFPALELNSITSGASETIIASNREGRKGEFQARFNYFDPELHWMLIRLMLKKDISNQKGYPIDMIYEELTHLVTGVDFQDYRNAVKRITDISRRILNADVVCLYQADASSPQLALRSQSGDLFHFPESLPSTDLIRLTETSLWEPGQRLITDIQRFAKGTEVDYLATSVLTEEGAKIGLLVASGKGAIPIELNLNAMQLISAVVTIFLQQSLLEKNLDQRLSAQQYALTTLDSITENMQEGMVVLSPDLKIIQVNPAAEWMLGYAEDEIKGQAVENILIGADRLLASLDEAKKGVVTPDIGKASLNRRNGQAFPVQIKTIPVIHDSKVTGVEILMVDISENEQSKALAKHLEHRAVIGDYTAAISHDAKNMQNSITSGVQLLSTQIPADDPKQETISKVLNDCARLTHLLESFLAYAKPNGGEQIEIDLSFFLQRMVDRWRPRFSKVGVTPLTNFEAGLPKVRGDSRSIDRVFSNLISNAVDAMADTGGTLAVKGEIDNSIPGHVFVAIHISDTGPGIPEDVRAHIFEPFVTTREKGTGLGLAITKEIITSHKGSISVDSFPGGTVFTVRLPAEIGD